MSCTKENDAGGDDLKGCSRHSASRVNNADRRKGLGTCPEAPERTGKLHSTHYGRFFFLLSAEPFHCVSRSPAGLAKIPKIVEPGWYSRRHSPPCSRFSALIGAPSVICIDALKGPTGCIAQNCGARKRHWSAPLGDHKSAIRMRLRSSIAAVMTAQGLVDLTKCGCAL